MTDTQNQKQRIEMAHLSFPRRLQLAFKAIVGTMSLADTQYYRAFPRLYAILVGGGPTYTGETVTFQTALNCSTVWACVRVISETTACLPLHLMRQGPDSKLPATDHPLYRVLHDEPNGEMADLEFRETLTAHCLTYGNGYARIVRQGGAGPVVGLWPIPPTEIRPDRTKEKKELLYIYSGDGQEKTLQPDQIFHLRGLGFDGVVGYPVVTMARQSIALAMVQEKFAAKWFARGGRRPYLLKHPTKFTSQVEADNFREQWQKAYESDDPFHKAAILTGGLDYTELGFTLEDAQLLASRQFSVPDICRWFRMQPHKVADLSRATFSNIEHLAIEFYTETLLPWCLRWEKAINRSLLLPEEKGKLFAKHNVAGLLRGDFQSRMAGYASLLQNGVDNIDEVRDLEDQNPLPNGAGKAHHIQLNMQTLPGTGSNTTIQDSVAARAAKPPAKGA